MNHERMRPVSGGLVDRPGDSPGKAFPGYLRAYGLLGSGVGLSVVITLSLTAYFIVRLSTRGGGQGTLRSNNIN